MAAPPTPPPPRSRTAVGHYFPRLVVDPDLHTKDFTPARVGQGGGTLPPGKRAELTTAFRRFRDVDQSDSMLRLGHRLLSELDAEYDIGSDVDFACLALNCCFLFRAAPTAALLDHIENVIVPKIKTASQMETLLSALKEMGEASRLRNVLVALVPRIDTAVSHMPRGPLLFVCCALVEAGVTPPLLMQSMLERAVMLVGTMSFHEIAQLCLCLATIEQRPTDVKETLETEFAPRLLHLIDFAMAQDLAIVLYSFAEIKVALPELVAQCAARLYALHTDLDADGIAMTFTALALMELRAPKLSKALLSLVKELDLSTVTALGALDMAFAMAHIGVDDDLAVSLLTGRIMSERHVVLANPQARQRLVQLSNRLVQLAQGETASDAAVAPPQ